MCGVLPVHDRTTIWDPIKHLLYLSTLTEVVARCRPFSYHTLVTVVQIQLYSKPFCRYMTQNEIQIVTTRMLDNATEHNSMKINVCT